MSVFTTNQIILIFFSCVAVCLAFLVAKKIYYMRRWKMRYFVFPKIDSRGIANTAMIIAISISIIILLTVLTAGLIGILFRIYPGWRVTIEGILIKIGGLIFGPIIGLFIGGVTDILTVALTAGMFHYGYFIASLAYGFFAGLIRSILNTTKKNTVTFTIISTFLAGLITTLLCLYLYTSAIYGENGKRIFQFTLFNFSIDIDRWYIITGFIILSSVSIAVMWISLFVCDRIKFKTYILKTKRFFKYEIKETLFKHSLRNARKCNIIAAKQLNWKTKVHQEYLSLFNNIKSLEKRIVALKNDNWYQYLAPVILLIFVFEPLVDIILMPLFDAELGGGMPVSYWIPFRSVTFPFVALVNFAIVFPVYKTIMPMMKYDYTTSLKESKEVPLFV